MIVNMRQKSTELWRLPIYWRLQILQKSLWNVSFNIHSLCNTSLVIYYCIYDFSFSWEAKHIKVSTSETKCKVFYSSYLFIKVQHFNLSFHKYSLLSTLCSNEENNAMWCFLIEPGTTPFWSIVSRMKEGKQTWLKEYMML